MSGSHFCLNSSAINEKDEFSEPVPVIGLYIAGATLVCLLFMLGDVLVGLFHKKKWLPCRFFPLNALTLTLIGIGSKLPVDLTSEMYSSQEQLSKLTSTTIICIAMGFFMPSLGTMGRSVCFSNMAAWSIFVITVIVNICIQMGTGVIFTSFYVEHTIIMFYMLVMLAVLWFSAVEILHEKEIASDLHADLLADPEWSMLDKLKYCFVYSYISNPQLMICRTPYVSTIGVLSFSCSLVALEASFRSLITKEKRCGAESDYGWSVPIIVSIQMVFVVVGAIATNFRLLTSVLHLDMPSSRDLLKDEVEHLKLQWMFHGGNVFKFLVRVSIILVLVGVVITNYVLALPSYIATKVFGMCTTCYKTCCKCICFTSNKDIQELRKVLASKGIEVEDWTLEKGQEDLAKLIKSSEEHSPHHLITFLKNHPSSYRPSEDSYIEQTGRKFIDGYKVSCLSVVFLAKVAEKSSPENSKSLNQTLNQAFKIIYFIDKKTSPATFESRRKRRFAKEVWKGGKFIKNIKCCDAGLPTKAFSLTTPSGKAKKKSPFGFVSKEIDLVEDLLKHHNAEKLLADMLHGLLCKLPKAIEKNVSDCPPEEYEKRTKHGIIVLCKLKSLDKTQWVSNLINNRVAEDSTDLVRTNVTGEIGEVEELEC